MATKTGITGLEIEFIAETNSLVLFWKDGPADYGDEVRPGVVVDYADGKAIGIEILGGAREIIADLATKSKPSRSKRGSANVVVDAAAKLLAQELSNKQSNDTPRTTAT